VSEAPTRFVLGSFGASGAALDAFRRGTDVELDLRLMPADERGRVLDLVTGAVYCLDGDFRWVAEDVLRVRRASPPGDVAGAREPRRPRPTSGMGAVAVEVTEAR
jgi:hypothetical protein